MVVGAVLAAGFVFFVVPRIVGLGPTLKRLRGGGIGRLALGVGLEAFSMLGDIVMFRGAFAAHGTPIGWRPTADIPMAGAAATKLLAAAGSGGIALTVWTLRGWGLSAAEVAGGLACYLLLTYAVYLLALAGAGFGLWLGLFPGPAPVGLTLIPAIVAAAAILVVLSMLHLDAPTERLLERRAERSTGRTADTWRRAATLPRTIIRGCSPRLTWSGVATGRSSALASDRPRGDRLLPSARSARHAEHGRTRRPDATRRDRARREAALSRWSSDAAAVQVVGARPGPDSGAVGAAAKYRYAIERLTMLANECAIAVRVSCVEAPSPRRGLHAFASRQRADLLSWAPAAAMRSEDCCSATTRARCSRTHRARWRSRPPDTRPAPPA